MPNRIIRDGILSSESVCSLSWAEEILYRRLMSIVDDYGRMEANLQFVRSRCYPLQVDKVTLHNVDQWMGALIKNGLIEVYQVDQKSYLQITKFGQPTRSKSKCPPPPESNCKQMISNESNCNQMIAPSVSVSVSECVSVSEEIASNVSGRNGSKPPQRMVLMTMADLEEFQANPAYASLDLTKEAFKFKTWCKTNGKYETRRRFQNWINRIA